MTMLAIVNPAAGGGRCGKRAPEAIADLRSRGVAVDVRETERPGDATRIAEAAWRDGTRDFLSVGGDGTTWEIVNGLYPHATTDTTPRLGFLPLGTGNSFLRDFTNDGPRYAADAIADGRTRPCDVIRATHTDGAFFYTNLLSIGFTADVGGLVNRRLKAFGEAGYGLGVAWEVARLRPRPMPHVLDDGVPRTDPVVFLSFNNSKFTGGQMMMAPHADCADGLIECVTVGAMGRLTLLRTFPKIFKGTHLTHPAVQEERASRVRFELDGPVDVMVDGEVLAAQLTELDVLPHALQVFA